MADKLRDLARSNQCSTFNKYLWIMFLKFQKSTWNTLDATVF